MKTPPLGYTTPVKLVRVIDGDTIKVRLEKEFIVRLKDFNAPEIRKPASDEEIAKGKECKNLLNSLLPYELILFIPISKDNDIGDVFSIGSRVIGDIFVDNINIVEILKDFGFGK